jgi:hypothetical protein
VERFLTTAEKVLVRALIDKSPGFAIPSEWLDNVVVVPMDDGGMGSLRFLPVSAGQMFGKQLSEIAFHDADGVVVTAALMLDKSGIPFELDIWKVDNTPLIQIPDHFGL